MTWDNIGKVLTIIGLLALNFVAFSLSPFLLIITIVITAIYIHHKIKKEKEGTKE